MWYEDFKNLFNKYLELVVDCISEFRGSINDFERMALSDARRRLSKSIEKEKAADEYRRKIMSLLEASEIPPTYKEDVSHLVKRLELIADGVKEAASTLTIIPYLEIPSSLRRNYVRMIDKVHEAAKRASEAVKALLDLDYDKAFKLSDDVEKLEEDADMITVETKTMLVDLSDKVKPVGLLIVLFDLLNYLESAANACEDAADVVRALIVEYKSHPIQIAART
ncbi:MAG: DUF47 family protein [Desulfurococcaceae archaeon]